MSYGDSVETVPLVLAKIPAAGNSTSRGSATMPPLRGDGKGGYKGNLVLIVVISGAGKSTLAAELAAMLNLPCIHLDRFYWQPGWREASSEDFRSRVFAALDEDPRGWIVDGNYTRVLGTKISGEATDVIWLDPPLILYFPRLVCRTFLRLFRLSPPCSTGCEEKASEVFFSRDSIIWWCLTNHTTVRKREAERYHTDGVHVGGNCRRIGGWGRELAAWKREVQATIQGAASGVASD